MNEVAILSKNPVKVELVKDVVSHYFPKTNIVYHVLDVEMNGSEPFGRAAILSQARETIRLGKVKQPDADCYVCMEGGMIDEGGRMVEIAQAVVQTRGGLEAISGCTTFDVPPVIANEVRAGADFAKAVDTFFETNGTKTGGGYFTILTGGLVTKKDHYKQAVASALGRIVHDDWY